MAGIISNTFHAGIKQLWTRSSLPMAARPSSIGVCALQRFHMHTQTRRQFTTERGIQAVLLHREGVTDDEGLGLLWKPFSEIFANEGVPITITEAREPWETTRRSIHSPSAQWAFTSPTVEPRVASRIFREIFNMGSLEKGVPSVLERWKKKHGKPPSKLDFDRMEWNMRTVQQDCLRKCAKLIPGTLETVKLIKNWGWQVGSLTGYSHEFLKVLAEEAKKQGYEPDVSLGCETANPNSSSPDNIWKNCMQLGVPTPSVVIVSGTVSGIRKGLMTNAWTIFVTHTSDEVGLSKEERDQLDPQKLPRQLKYAEKRVAGIAHFVANTIADIFPHLITINDLIKKGILPSHYLHMDQKVKTTPCVIDIKPIKEEPASGACTIPHTAGC